MDQDLETEHLNNYLSYKIADLKDLIRQIEPYATGEKESAAGHCSKQEARDRVANLGEELARLTAEASEL